MQQLPEYFVSNTYVYRFCYTTLNRQACMKASVSSSSWHGFSTSFSPQRNLFQFLDIVIIFSAVHMVQLTKIIKVLIELKACYHNQVWPSNEVQMDKTFGTITFIETMKLHHVLFVPYTLGGNWKIEFSRIPRFSRSSRSDLKQNQWWWSQLE